MTPPHALRTELTTGLAISARQWMRLIEVALARLGESGISAACAVPLILIGRSGGGLNQIALAEQMGVVGPSLVRLLDQLCQAELVQRQEDPADRRAKTLWLTTRGQHLSERFEACLQALREQVFSQVSSADLQAAVRVQRAIANAASQLDACPPRRRRSRP